MGHHPPLIAATAAPVLELVGKCIERVLYTCMYTEFLDGCK